MVAFCALALAVLLAVVPTSASMIRDSFMLQQQARHTNPQLRSLVNSIAPPRAEGRESTLAANNISNLSFPTGQCIQNDACWLDLRVSVDTRTWINVS